MGTWTPRTEAPGTHTHFMPRPWALSSGRTFSFLKKKKWVAYSELSRGGFKRMLNFYRRVHAMVPLAFLHASTLVSKLRNSSKPIRNRRQLLVSIVHASDPALWRQILYSASIGPDNTPIRRGWGRRSASRECHESSHRSHSVV